LFFFFFNIAQKREREEKAKEGRREREKEGKGERQGGKKLKLSSDAYRLRCLAAARSTTRRDIGAYTKIKINK
jgi:hypothetical protein